MTARNFWICLAFAASMLAGCGDDDRRTMDAGSLDGAADADTPPECPTGTSMCGDECVDTQNSSAHCGACDNACAAGEACVAGACGVLCPSGQTICDGACVDTNTDRYHCSACGTACADGEICVAGACEISCPSGQTVCDGTCADTNSDPSNCGACGTVCEAGEVCDSGSCALACSTGLMECSAACVDTTNSPNHCGACDNACTATAADASGLCFDGSCRVVCDALYGDCNADLGTTGTDGCETSLATDIANCGACNRQCVLANALPGCSAGACVVASCAAGFGDCDSDASNGCETPTRNDAANCGGCGIACGATEACVAGACYPQAGESCTDVIALTEGSNAVVWTAATADYLTSAPSCTTYSPDGPDVVLSYTATGNEEVTLAFDKPASNRWMAVVSTAACGTTTELACLSEYSDPQMVGTFSLATGETAYIYVADTTSGSAPLDNPLGVTVTGIDCATDPAPSVVELTPANAGFAGIHQLFRVRFDGVVSTSTGTVTISGDMGTSLSYDLSTSPSEVSFSTGGTVMEINPATAFTPGEALTLSLTGMEGGVCTGGGTITSPTWGVTVATPSCTPGMGGMVGTTTARLAGPSSSTEYYVAADEDPNGWVYVGGTSELQRIPKAGGAAEDVEALAGIGFDELGYTMVIYGLNIYTVESNTSGTTEHIWRISTDGGASWVSEDYALFPTAPNDDFRGSTVYQGRIYLVTEDSSETEVWSMPAAATTLPVTPTLELTLPGIEDCSGLTRDSSYYYLACNDGDRVWRVPSYGSDPVVIVDDLFDLSGTAESLFGADLDADGVHDVLYLKSDYEEVYYICDPDGSVPYPATLTSVGTDDFNYGMGFDRTSNTLWLFDDDTEEFISIQ